MLTRSYRFNVMLGPASHVVRLVPIDDGSYRVYIYNNTCIKRAPYVLDELYTGEPEATQVQSFLGGLYGNDPERFVWRWKNIAR